MTNSRGGGGRDISTLLTYYRKNDRFSADDVARIEYAYRSIKNDAIKIVLLYVIAAPFHQGFYLTCVLIPMIILRMLVGGMHRPTFWQCFLMTAGWVFGGMFVGSFVMKNVRVASTIMVLTTIGVLITGIAPSPKHRGLSRESQRRRKHIAVLLEISMVLIVLLGQNTMLQKGLFLSTLITNLQVIIRRIRKWTL